MTRLKLKNWIKSIVSILKRTLANIQKRPDKQREEPGMLKQKGGKQDKKKFREIFAGTTA